MRVSCNLKPASVNSWHTLTSMQNISAANISNIFENISKLPQNPRKIFLNCRETIWCFPPVRQTERGDMRLVQSFSTGTRTLFIRERPQTLSCPKLLDENANSFLSFSNETQTLFITENLQTLSSIKYLLKEARPNSFLNKHLQLIENPTLIWFSTLQASPVGDTSPICRQSAAVTFSKLDATSQISEHTSRIPHHQSLDPGSTICFDYNPDLKITSHTSLQIQTAARQMAIVVWSQ